ncbi:hypothetical protein [Glutamicibacter soli]
MSDADLRLKVLVFLQLGVKSPDIVDIEAVHAAEKCWLIQVFRQIGNSVLS